MPSSLKRRAAAMSELSKEQVHGLAITSRGWVKLPD